MRILLIELNQITWTLLDPLIAADICVPEVQQPPETIRAKRLWELAAEGGRVVGVFGSLNS